MTRALFLALAALATIACGGQTSDDTVVADSTPGTRPSAAPIDSTALARPTDASMLASVRERFEVMGGMKDVTVAVDSGVVRLSGTVRTEDRIQTATDVANEFGAVRVDNKITVKL